MKWLEKNNALSVMYPFVIYKDTIKESMKETRESLIHINTLAQMCYQAFLSNEQAKIPYLLVLDRYAINGVGEPGVYQFYFELDAVKKMGDIHINSFLPTDYRIGLLYEFDDEMELLFLVNKFKKMIQIHGDLSDHIDYQKFNLKQLAVQWIREKGSDDQ